MVGLGAEILGGGLTGVAAGFLIGGPAGTALGGAVGPIVRRGFQELANRVLSHREQVRVSAAAQFVLERYDTVLATGMTPRTDMPTGPSADELLEGVLQKARSSYQEKKVRLIANIFADFAFVPDLGVDEAHTALSLVESLTYRQLVLLAIFQSPARSDLRAIDYRGNVGTTLELFAALQDVYHLFLTGLVVNQPKGDAQSDFMLGWHDVTPAATKPTPLGAIVCTLMGSDTVPESDKQPLIDLLGAQLASAEPPRH